jgi:F0F1-type ATP synthase gamma subunit
VKSHDLGVDGWCAVSISADAKGSKFKRLRDDPSAEGNDPESGDNAKGTKPSPSPKAVAKGKAKPKAKGKAAAGGAKTLQQYERKMKSVLANANGVRERVKQYESESAELAQTFLHEMRTGMETYDKIRVEHEPFVSNFTAAMLAPALLKAIRKDEEQYTANMLKFMEAAEPIVDNVEKLAARVAAMKASGEKAGSQGSDKKPTAKRQKQNDKGGQKSIDKGGQKPSDQGGEKLDG